VTLPLDWILLGMGAFGLMSFAFGIFTGFCPKRSIDLYVWLMSKLNWRVHPIDEVREIRNTRMFGIFLVFLSLIPVLQFLLRVF